MSTTESEVPAVHHEAPAPGSFFALAFELAKPAATAKVYIGDETFTISVGEDNLTKLRHATVEEFSAQVGPIFDAFLRENDTQDQLRGHTFDRAEALAVIYRFANGVTEESILKELAERQALDPEALTPETMEVFGFTRNSPCFNATVSLVLESLMMVLTVLGFPGRVTGKIAGQIVSKVSMNGLQALIKAIRTASGAARAQAVMNLVVGIYNMTGVGVWWAAIKNALSWWDWIVMGFWIGIQIAAFVLSAGASFMIWLISMVAQSAFLILAIKNYVLACHQ